MERAKLEQLQQVARGIAAQFGPNCEVVVHDLSRHPDHTIVFIENGHVSGRKVGDGASQVVLEQMEHSDPDPKDRYCYMTRTPDGKILKSSTIYLRGSRGKVSAILAVNYDISELLLLEGAVHKLTAAGETEPAEPARIINVNALLDDLIARSVSLVGKPAALMNKDDKIRAISFLNQNGAFLVTKSSEKIAKYFGISKYTLYAYIEKSTGGQEA